MWLPFSTVKGGPVTVNTDHIVYLTYENEGRCCGLIFAPYSGREDNFLIVDAPYRHVSELLSKSKQEV